MKEVEPNDRLVWMDLEMTGLDPDTDVIVEIAVLITDDNLQVINKGLDIVLQTPPEVLARMPQVVRDMHTKSGLLTAIEQSKVTHAEAALQALTYIQAHVPGPGIVPLCGNTIGMDRRFLAKHMPEIENFLHYRSIDVSSLKELCRRWYPQVFKDRPGKSEKHRALDDIQESIAELAYYRQNMLRL